MRPNAILALSLAALAFLAPDAVAGKWLKWGHHADRIQGSGHFETRTFDVEGFDAIRIDGVFEVDVTIADRFTVEVEAEDNLFDYLVIETRRDELVLDIDDDVEIETDEKVLVKVTMPALVEIDGNGVYELRARGLDNQETRVYAEGVGSIELEGRTVDLRVDCEGVGNVDLRELVATNANVRVEGIGDVIVYVEGDLTARVSGLGDIRYAGDPRSVDDHVDGFGSIEPAD